MHVGTERPYPPTGLNTRRWAKVPPTWLDYDQLTTTQDGVYIAAVLTWFPRPGSDGYPHVVSYDGRLYLEDGHTRVVRDLLGGHRGGWVRVHPAP